MSNSTAVESIPEEFWKQLRMSTYIAVGTAAMALWDLVVNVENDYLILSRKMVTIPTLAYFLCRLSMLGTAIADAVFLTLSTTKCKEINLTMESFLFISVFSTTLLLYFRLKAIYYHNRTVIIAFFILWVITVGCTALLFRQREVLYIPDPLTHQHVCLYSGFDFTTGILNLNAILVHDTLVFIAVSLELFKNSHLDFDGSTEMGTVRASSGTNYSAHITGTILNMKQFFSGQNLPAFSRAFLRNGQIYYLISLLATITTNVIICTPVFSIPGMKNVPGLRIMFFIPHATLISAISCHAFRQVRFGLIHELAEGPILPIRTLRKPRAVSGQARVGRTEIYDCGFKSPRVEGVMMIGNEPQLAC
ncbi:hypothetical protein D9758_011217 [Tetrapyrgos nigripes]|uniref:Uncharacterized protein n=1 Tax=Tetrapyrgos nigripes TaxID=182062 RepID=A0A8H5D975_9AGAR|nr:hypothetical protein D9758_011217 [Tetrapyrgos nigripes]